ncbi:MAG TPA: BrnT family toxin [Sphingomicrobium sp.]|nr:BrnT family toxin [Sphingomicrobium sp.]
MSFEFDPAKSAANKAKHGLDFKAAQALWRDERRVSGPTRSPDEERWMVVGMIDGKLWSAVVTYRDEAIRIISVRRSRPKEAAAYGRQVGQDH